MSEPSDVKRDFSPQWQRSRIDTERGPPSSQAEYYKETGPPPSPSRSALLKQAVKFLEEDEVRNASTERKTAFLESKGLDSNEINQVLREAEKSGTPTEAAPVEGDESSPSHASSSQPVVPSTHESLSPSAPPIITYPEFLTHSPTPSPPLLTISRLLSSLYVAGGTAASLHGVNKYIVTPMLTSLTSARHELASITQINISTLNTKLSTLVSEIPSSAQKPPSHNRTEEGDSDAESDDSDPNELFHRDYGTQTSPSLSRRPSDPSLNSSSAPPQPTQLVAQETRLNNIRAHLSELLDDNTSLLSSSDEVSTRIQDLTTYLNGLSYSSSYYSSAGVYGGAISGAGLGGVGATAAAEDMVAKVKMEIRGVKGVLLSARNFPGGSSRGAARVGD